MNTVCRGFTRRCCTHTARHIRKACKTSPLIPSTPLFDERPRQTSSTSIASTISPSLATNDENIAPYNHAIYQLRPSPVGQLSALRGTCQQGQATDERTPASVPLRALIPLDGIQMANPKPHQTFTNGTVAPQTMATVESEAKQTEIGRLRGPDIDSGSDDLSRVEIDDARAKPVVRNRLHKKHGSIEPYTSSGGAHVIAPAATMPRERHTEISSYEQSPTFLNQDFRGHRKRLSTASSCVVHTLKTASFSNASLSMLSRSFRLGHSSDTPGNFGSRQRFSIDSDRPSTSTSVDEAALRRSIKRKHILDELIATEESYVDDLKALVYLISTLLASTNSVSKSLKSAILQNISEILHLHEELVEKLHNAFFRIAARNWAAILSPKRVTSPRHVRWRSVELTAVGPTGRKGRNQRSYSDSSNGHRAQVRLGASDPADVSAVIMIFNSLVTRLLAYEEYCANHEIVTQELQKQMPEIWSTYESGLESLAKCLVSLDRRSQIGNRAVTVGDLLIKPIQRICKYPLLFADLLKSTPVVDCPSAHAEIESILVRLHNIVQAVNSATHSHDARSHIQRRWSLQSKLDFSLVAMQVENFRSLGYAVLCGILHVCYHAKSGIDGMYGVCILFDSHLVVAVAAGASTKFEVVAIIRLTNLQIETASNGIGLQCPSTLYTWKICFAINGQLHELLLSACSQIEEERWKIGLRGSPRDPKGAEPAANSIQSSVAFDLRSVGALYGSNTSLTRRASVQRAVTVGNKSGLTQVIIRNTFNHQDLHGYRQDSTSAIGRSQSHLTPRRTTILAPKRSERTRLEAVIEDVWTKDKLPYPGMIASRSTQIIRASAGSLVRKLSLASMHGPFSRRSGSLSLSSKRSTDALTESQQMTQTPTAPKFEIRRNSLEEMKKSNARNPAHGLPELDTMDRVVHRMIGGQQQENKRHSLSHKEGIWRKASTRKKALMPTTLPISPDDPADVFYAEDNEKKEEDDIFPDEAVTRKRKKRWSNPVDILKGFSTESIRNMLYSSK